MTEQELKKIAQKIAKCLALSASTNPNEAEVAQRQANVLMKKYNLSAGDVAASQVKEQCSKTGGKYQAPLYLCNLARFTARAFGCEAISSTGGGFQSSVIRFLGLGSKPVLAAYTFDVLRRQLNKDRAIYYATLNRYKPANRIRSADIFCDAWIFNIHSQVHEFAGNKDELEAIASYKKKRFTRLENDSRERVDIKKSDHNAINAGLLASEHVALNKPVQSKSGKAITHQGAM